MIKKTTDPVRRDRKQGPEKDLSAEEELTEEMDGFRLVAEGSSKIFFYTHGTDHKFEYLSPSVENVLGYQPGELFGKPYMQLLITDDLENDQIYSRTEKTMRSGEPISAYLASVAHKDGRRIVLEIQEIPVLRQDSVVGIQGFAYDVSERMTAREAMERSDAKFRILFDHAGIGMCFTDADGRFLRTNRRFCKILGYSAAEILKGKGIETTHPDDREAETEKISRMLAGDFTSSSWDKRYIHKSGEIVWCHLTLSIVPDSEENGHSFMGVIEDITSRRQAEEMLRQNLTMKRIAGRLAHLGAWSVDLPSYKLTWSREAGEIHDLPPGETPTYEEAIRYYTPEYRAIMKENIRALATDGTAMDQEAELITAKKKRIWVRTIGEAERDSDGRIARIHGAIQDISKSKQADLALVASNRALQLLSRCGETLIRSKNETDLLSEICDIAITVGGYSLAWVGYVRNDADKTIEVQASAGTRQEYLDGLELSADEERPNGRSPACKVIRSGEPLITPDLSKDPGCAPWLEKATSTGLVGEYVLPLKNETGTFGVLVLYTSEVRPNPSEDEVHLLSELAEDLAYGIGSIRSETDRRRMETVMQKMAVSVSANNSKNFFHKLVKNMAEALDADAAFVASLSKDRPGKARTIAGTADGESLANFEYDVCDGPCAELVDGGGSIVSNRIDELYPESFPLREFQARAYAGRVLVNTENETNGFLFLLYRRHIEPSDFLSSALKIFSNRAIAELGRLKSDLRLQEQASLLDKARDAILVRDMDHAVRYCNESAKELYGWTDDGAEGESDIDLLYCEPEDYEKALEATLASGEWNGEIEQLTKTGDKILVETRWTLVTDEKGGPVSILSINSDITERKKMEEHFMRAQRMEGLGNLAGGIAHDLNNVLAPIMMSLDMLKSEEESSEKLGVLEILESSAQRGADMVKQILSFARGVEGQKLEVDVEKILKELKRLADETFPKNIRVNIDIPSTLLGLRGDPSQLHQVLLNLCVNARDAMPDGGTISLAAHNLKFDDHYAAMTPEAQPGPYICIQVEDTGTGIPAKLLNQIFDPFFTTKGPGKGTGLGLSTTVGIIKGHGGFVRTYSEEGVGTRFNVYLPALKDTAPKNSEEPEDLDTLDLRGDGQLILVVDDEPGIRRVTKQTLENSGYRVVVASDGAEATAIYGVRRDEIAAVLTDMMMPIMDGPATIRVLKRINPEVRIIAASGLNRNGVAAKAASDGVRHFLPKPYTAETLLKALHQVLQD